MDLEVPVLQTQMWTRTVWHCDVCGAFVAFEGTVTIIGLRHLTEPRRAVPWCHGAMVPWLSSPPQIGEAGSFLGQ